jgi:hypothetical protein
MQQKWFVICLQFLTQYCKQARVQRESFHKVHNFYSLLEAQYVIVAKGHMMLKPLYKWCNL